MPFTLWNQALGATQGRIAPLGFVPSEGSFALVLGCDLAGLSGRLEIGDFIEARQRADFGDAKLVRVRLRLRPPTTVPAAVRWRFAIRIDDIEHGGAVIAPGRTRDRVDLVANVSKLVGDHDLAFRLALVAR